MSKKIYFILLVLITVTSLLIYGAQFVTAHTGGGTTAHGDTIDLKITEVWIGSSSSDLTKVFSGPSDGPVTVTATQDQFMSLTVEAQLTTVDSILDNINPFSENWPDIEEEVFWDDFVNRHYYYSPTDTIRVMVREKVSDVLSLDGVPDNQLLIDVVGWFGEASLQDTHTVSDEAILIIQPPGGSQPAPTINVTASPMSVAQGQSTTVSWISTNATSCTGSRGGSYPTSGSFIDTPSSTRSYGMTCTGPGGNATDSVTVTVSAAPPPPTPIGYHDGVDNGNCRTWGWTYDRSATSASIAVYIYKDGPAGGGGTVLNSFPTNVLRSDVNSTYGVSGNHGFDANLSSYIADGLSHPLYIYAIDTEGVSNPLLTNSPKTIQCAAPVGPQPSVDIKGQ